MYQDYKASTCVLPEDQDFAKTLVSNLQQASFCYRCHTIGVILSQEAGLPQLSSVPARICTQDFCQNGQRHRVDDEFGQRNFGFDPAGGWIDQCRFVRRWILHNRRPDRVFGGGYRYGL